MNISTIAGLAIGVLIVLFAIGRETSNPAMFLDLNGFLIVVGGTVAAAVASYPLRELIRIGKVVMLVLSREPMNLTETIHQLRDLSGVMSREGIDALEELLPRCPPFLRSGLEMVVDQVHPDEILSVLERRIELTYEREMNEVGVLRTLARMAPSLGMLGTTVGLVTMMSNLDFEGFSKMGMGLATALTTTFYGLVLAHLVFTPLANRLEKRAEERVVEMRVMSEGVLLLARRVPPTLVMNRLQAYVPPRMWSDSTPRKSQQSVARDASS